MNIEDTITEKLQQGLKPDYLEVMNESHMHNVPPGSESHFKIVAVTSAFDGKMLIARHRMINKILKDEMQVIHALALHTMTPAEWAEKGEAPTSPPCMGVGQ